jgi:SWI/SNF-related matrix-associated actin-dependent regulator of chromatin subfamily A3
LPPRIDEVHYIDFAPAEREKYEAAKNQSRVLLDEAICSGDKIGKTFNALGLLNILRLICSHGLLARSALERKVVENACGGWLVKDGANSQFGDISRDSATCTNCGANLWDALLERSSSADLGSRGQVDPCENMLCEECNSQINYTGSGQLCWDHLMPCESASSRVSLGPGTLREDISTTSPIDSMSTKIKTLVSDLLKYHEYEKRFVSRLNCHRAVLTHWQSVVFSYWTYSLDLVQMMLDDCGIAYTRIDGKTTLPRRTQALRAFHKDDSLRVILVSITCGGAG